MISVIIPTLNEEAAIGDVLDMIPRTDDMEIMIVDGLSTDRTVEIAEARGARTVMENRRGYGRAYKTGFSEAAGDIIVTLDGDLTYPAEKVLELVDYLLTNNLDFLSCDRLSQLNKKTMTSSHRFGNWLLKVTANVLFRLHLNDSQTGMWVFRKSIFEKIQLESDGMPLSEEIKIKSFRHPDIQAEEVPIDYRIREGEVKLNSWKDGWTNLKFLFHLRFSKKK
jgi:glycosyltransferase involved in cell wall biosynthesis